MIGRAGLLAAILVAAILVEVTGRAQARPLFVASQGGAELARLESDTAALVGRSATERAPAGIAADARGRVYLTHPDHRAVTVLDGTDGHVIARLPFAGQAFGIAADPQGRFVLVGDWSAGKVSRLSALTGAVEGVVEVGREPANLVLDRVGRAYVADRESAQVSVVDTERMVRIATIPVGKAPFALSLSPDESRLYVANVRSDDLSVVDTRTMGLLATVPVGPMPYGVAASPDNRLVLVTNQHAGTVTVLDAETLARRAQIKVGQYPEGILVAGDRAFVANWFSDDVSVIDLATLRETARIPVGEGPRNLCQGAVAPGGTAR